MYPEFTMNPHCGAATFVMIGDKGDIVPITRVVDVDRFAEIFWDVYYQARKGSKTKAKLTLLKLLPIIKSKTIRALIQGVITKGSYEALGDLMRSTLMISVMHFMDASNMDLERTRRCAIHYATPDGRIISFCTYNSLHRPEVEKRFAISLKGWMTAHKGKKLNDAV